MKKIIILLTIVTISFQLKSQDAFIPGLAAQNTYNDTFKLVVAISDDTTIDARYITLGTATPKIKDETLESATLDKDLTYLRISDNASNTEYKTLLRKVNPNIVDLSTGSTIITTDYLTFYDGGNTRDERITYQNFMLDFTNEGTFTGAVDSRFGNSAFTTAVNSDIDNRVDSTYIIDKIGNTITGQSLQNSATEYGQLYASKVGNSVTLLITSTNTTSEVSVDNYNMPSNFRPIAGADVTIVGDLQGNFISVDGSGNITIRVANGSQRASGGYYSP